MLSASNRKYSTLLLISALMLPAGMATARQNSVTGSIGTGFDYENRTYDDESAIADTSSGDRRELSVFPEIIVRSVGEHNSISFSYSPIVVYDDIDDETDVDHYLNIDGEHFFSKNWKIEITDSFRYTTDPDRYGADLPVAEGEEIAEPDTDQLTQNLGRVRYWTNNAGLQTTYTYAEESDITTGYELRILRNDTDEGSGVDLYDEYDRHRIFAIWGHQINPSYRTEVDAAYVIGSFDADEITGLSQDVDEYTLGLLFEWEKDSFNAFPAQYRFTGSEYEDTRRDVQSHELTFGWRHSFDSRTQMSLGVGPSYVEADGLDGDWGYNGYFRLGRTYRHGSVRLSLDKRFLPRNFSGSDDSGLTDQTDIRLDTIYRFTRDLQGSLFAAYRYEDILEPRGEFLDSVGGAAADGSTTGDISYTRDSYTFGSEVEYLFSQGFLGLVRYVYYNQDGDIASDTYDDHRVTLQLKFTRELWR